MKITPKHVENGRAMRHIVQTDIATRAMSFEQALQALANYLRIDRESVRLGIAIANDHDLPETERVSGYIVQ